MKNRIITLLFIVLASTTYLFGQKLLSGRYHNQNGTLTKGLNKPFYLQEIFKDNNGKIIVQQTYFDTQNTKLLGEYKGFNERFFVGKKIEGYENGNYKTISHYDKNGKLIDTAIFFYEDGKIKLIKKYDKPINVDSPDFGRIIDFFDTEGNQLLKNGTGYAEIENQYFVEKGYFKNYKRDSIWIGTFKTLNYSFEETYNDGNFLSGNSIDSLNNKNYYTVSEILVEPKYLGNIENLRSFLNKTDRSKKKSDYIKNAIGVPVELDGSVKEVYFWTDKLTNKQKNIIKTLLTGEGNWLPALYRGIKTRYTLTIYLADL